MKQPSEIIELSKPELIFVDIREEDVSFKDKYLGELITIDNYKLLYSRSGDFEKSKEKIYFLGLNAAFKLNEYQKSPGIRKSFWLKNSELFAGLCSVVSKWIQKDSLPSPNLDFNKPFLAFDWLKFLNAKVYTIEPKRNWYSFIVNLTNMKIFFNGSPISEHIEFLERQGYSLMLSAENGLGGESSPNIYFQIATRDDYAGSGIFSKVSLNTCTLTLGRTNLKVSSKQDPDHFFEYFYPGYGLDDLSKLLESSVRNFEKDLSNFVFLFQLMSKIPLDKRAYIALVLDLYDRNRNEASIDLDKRLQNLIIKTIKGALVGVKGNEYNWATLIRSVIINNSEDLNTKVKNNPYEITNQFSKKMVIQKMSRIYSEVVSRESIKVDEANKAIYKYISEQIKSLSQVEQFIQQY